MAIHDRSQSYEFSRVFALLENTKAPENDSESLLFTDPIAEVICHKKSDLNDSLFEIDRFRKLGFYACGYLTYEAGYLLVDKREFLFNLTPDNDTPLLHFYIFKNVRELNSAQASNLLQDLDAENESVAVHDFSLNMNRHDYVDSINKIRDYIRDGDTYQVNFTLKYRFKFQGNVISLYRKLRERQRVEFGALLNFPEFSVLSLSPELFLRKKDDHLESKPMKGTAARGLTEEEDAAIILGMKQDTKTLSENVIIVDLIRNDIGRVAEPRSVHVENMFEVKTYETLHQMISTIKGNVQVDISFAEILKGLFPCGSISGAPKIRTMQIIEGLEAERRGVYTGAIGYLTPNNDFCFNVPIRTCIAYKDNTAEMGIGGGIIYEADAGAEFEECLLKARFLTGINQSFQIIESMLYLEATRRIPKLDQHMLRLANTAEKFHFNFDRDAVLNAVYTSLQGLRGNHKIRISLYQSGHCEIRKDNLKAEKTNHGKPYVEVSQYSVNSRSLFLRHKTSVRPLYDKEYEKYSVQGAYDVIFINERGEITEASRHNLFIEKDDVLFTSPIESGLLDGIERAEFMKQKRWRFVEKALKPENLLDADRLFLTNAVRGVVEVQLSKRARALLAQRVKREIKDVVLG